MQIKHVVPLRFQLKMIICQMNGNALVRGAYKSIDIDRLKVTGNRRLYIR